MRVRFGSLAMGLVVAAGAVPTLAGCSLDTEQYSFDADTGAGGISSGGSGGATAGAAGASGGAGGSGQGGSSGSSGTSGQAGAPGGQAGSSGGGQAGASGSSGGGQGGAGMAGAAGAGTGGASGAGMGGSSGMAGGGGTGGVAGMAGTGGAGGAAGAAGACSTGDRRCNGNNIEECGTDGAFAKVETCDAASPCTMAASGTNAFCKVCDPNKAACNGQTIALCNADGSGFAKLTACADGEICDAVGNGGKGECDVCVADEYYCNGAELQQCQGDGQSLKKLTTCATAALCDKAKGVCTEPACVVGETKCDGDQPLICNADRTGFDKANGGASCGPGLCDAKTGGCFNCVPGNVRCSGDTLVKCALDGSAESTIVVCPAGTCDPNAQSCSQCAAGQHSCSGTQLQTCTGGKFVLEKECGPSGICDAPNDQCDVCSPGAYACSGSTLTQCSADGQNIKNIKDCGTAALCDAIGGTCLVCVPGSAQCDPGNPKMLQVCKADGSGYDSTDCLTAGLCNASAKQCDAPSCAVNQTRCQGKQWQVCNADRTGYSTTPKATCTSSQSCDDVDGCISPTKVWAGAYRSCATMGPKGMLYCWGENGYGELGNGTKSTSAPPSRVLMDPSGKPLTGVTSVSMGSDHTCAIASGVAYCWGYQDGGALGNGVDALSAEGYPQKVSLSSALKPVELSSFGANTCMTTQVASTGAASYVYCWGKNTSGQLGGDKVPHKIPTSVSGTSGAADVSMGGSHACAVVPVGSDWGIVCWGSNTYGQLGAASSVTESLTPLPVVTSNVGSPLPRLLSAAVVGAGGSHACASAGLKVYCWGSNTYGQLGVNNNNPSSFAVQSSISALQLDIGAGTFFNCSRSTTINSNSVYCWGTNANGQIGQGSFVKTSYLVPTVALTNKAVTSIGAGYAHACALATSGPNQILCAGYDYYGQLGDGKNADNPSFVPVVFP